MSDNCKDGASNSVSNDDDACDVNDLLNNMSANNGDVSVCANCGKEGDDVSNTCNKCQSVKYCNAVCKKVHKKKHKKDCEEHIRLAAEEHNDELRIAAELHDEKLFKQPPPNEDCPICFLLLPSLQSGWRYYACCGKTLCCGCVHAPVYDNQGNKVDNKKCPFCRTPWPSEEERIERQKKRMDLHDPIAVRNLGIYYRDGRNGYPKDDKKALELWHRAAELGHATAYCNIGYAYSNGEGVKVDEKKGIHYYELAAMCGNATARHNLGMEEGKAGNMERAFKHFMIAVRSGQNNSLAEIKYLYSKGYATKEEYTTALQSYQAYLGEIKSVQRDKAAAAHEKYRYY